MAGLRFLTHTRFLFISRFFLCLFAGVAGVLPKVRKAVDVVGCCLLFQPDDAHVHVFFLYFRDWDQKRQTKLFQTRFSTQDKGKVVHCRPMLPTLSD